VSRLLACFLLLHLTVGAAVAAGFSTLVPEGVPDLSTWERISGDLATARVELSYLLYVNPARGGLYQVIRYRARFLGPGDAPGQDYPPGEKLVWSEKPGRAHLRCFERVESPPGHAPRWREMAHGSAEYDLEMNMVMQLMGLHRALRQDDSGR
jgi:hypothetical protein